MKFKVGVPVVFTARPPRTRGIKDVAVHETRTFDIREVSQKELHPVLETDLEYETSRPEVRDGRLRSRHRTVCLLDGNLYRKVAKVAEVEALGLFDNPFPKTFHQYGGFRSGISYAVTDNLDIQVSNEALTAPLFHQQAWHIGHADLRSYRFDNFWPTDYPAVREEERGNYGEWWKRNHFSLETVLQRIRDFDHQGLEMSRLLADRHMEGFVIAGNDIWERCGSPAYRVQYSMGLGATATVTLVHVPRWHDRDLRTQYFALSDEDAAFEYAAEVLRIIASDPERSRGK